MRRAGPRALDELEPLLADLRAIGGLTERTRGCFYRKSKGFLHFHEDDAGVFADIKGAGGRYELLPVNTPAERRVILDRARDG